MAPKNETIHVYPNNDTFEHILDSDKCTCKPKVGKVEDTTIVIHNSFDGREILEHEAKKDGKAIQS